MCATVASVETVVLDGVMRDTYERLRRALPDCPLRYAPRRWSLEMPALLEDVPWSAYEGVLEAFGDRRFRHSYDRGTLEVLMSPKKGHDWIKKLIGRMIEAMCLDQNIPIQSVGSMTLRREKLLRGIEPDESYYVASEQLVRGKRIYDPEVDPPPDLAIEVDATSKSVARFPIYGRLGVPEVWRWHGGKVSFYRRKRDGEYAAIRHSASFPFLRPADIERFLAMAETADENGVVRAFVKWARSAASAGKAKGDQ
jgi:Uma2 family endonuclease